MTRPPRKYCIRCTHDVDVEYEHSSAMRRWWKVYFIAPILLAPTWPSVGMNYVVTLPFLLPYLFGIGPVLSVIHAPPTCAECGAFIPLFVDTWSHQSTGR